MGLNSWGVVQLDVLLQQYVQEKHVEGHVLPPLVDVTARKQEFFAFKLQECTKWMDKTFGELWPSISWNPSLKLKYPKLLILSQIAKCQCVSTVTCERAFPLQNSIKLKNQNHMTTLNLDSIMQVSMEGLEKDFDAILLDAIVLWKNSTIFKHLFTNLERYLIEATEDMLEEGENLEF